MPRINKMYFSAEAFRFRNGGGANNQFPQRFETIWFQLIHWGPVTLYGDTELNQNWLK